MTWDYIFMLALGAYAFKSSGLIILNKFNLDRFFLNSVSIKMHPIHVGWKLEFRIHLQ